MVRPRYEIKAPTSKDPKGRSKDYIPYGTCPKERRAELLTDDNIASFSDILDLYARGIAIQRTCEKDATPSEEDKLIATKMWKRIELHIQEVEKKGE